MKRGTANERVAVADVSQQEKRFQGRLRISYVVSQPPSGNPKPSYEQNPSLSCARPIYSCNFRLSSAAVLSTHKHRQICPARRCGSTSRWGALYTTRTSEHPRQLAHAHDPAAYWPDIHLRARAPGRTRQFRMASSAAADADQQQARQCLRHEQQLFLFCPSLSPAFFLKKIASGANRGAGSCPSRWRRQLLIPRARVPRRARRRHPPQRRGGLHGRERRGPDRLRKCVARRS